MNIFNEDSSGSILSPFVEIKQIGDGNIQICLFDGGQVCIQLPPTNNLINIGQVGFDSLIQSYIVRGHGSILTETKTNSMILDKNLFTAYYLMICSNIDNLITVGLQELFFLLESGYILLPNCRTQLEGCLLSIIKNNKNARIRRWAYMVSSFGNNRLIINASKQNLKYETDDENKTWIIALISKVLTYDEFVKEMKKQDVGLEWNNIMLSTYLFSDYPSLDDHVIKKIMSNGDDYLSLFWIGSIAAYHHIRNRCKKDNIASTSNLLELTSHHNPNVAKHYIGALWKQNSLSISKMKIDYRDYKNMNFEPKKWFLTAIWKDSNFIKHNYDFLKELLSDEHLFKYSDEKVREGFARGLLDYSYDPNLVWDILHWLSYEDSYSVKYFLYSYINRNKYMDSNYYDIFN